MKSRKSAPTRARHGAHTAKKAPPGKTEATTDHDRIRQWAEERGGHPASVRATARRGDPGLLRIDFPGYSGEGTLKEISWDEFFDKFDHSDLTFLYQDKTKSGGTSRFCKLVWRETLARK